MIAIIDYGVGNLYSLRCSLAYIGAPCTVTGDATEIKAADKIILPGVGAFGDAMLALKNTGLGDVIVSEAKKGKPLLGICLGMQLLYENSCEYGEHRGLGLIPGRVESLATALYGEKLKVPHMGWNSIAFDKSHPLFKYIGEGAYVYYVHSYYAAVSEYTAAHSRYGSIDVTGVCTKDNISGTQFHPEKSGDAGLSILWAFAEN